MNLVYNLLFGTVLGVGLATLLTVVFALILGPRGKPPKPSQVLLLIAAYFGVIFIGFAVTTAFISPASETRQTLDKTALYTWIIVFLLGYMRLWIVDLRRRRPTVGTDLQKGPDLTPEELERLIKADGADDTHH